MKNTLLFILLLYCSSFVTAQKIHRNYSFYPQEEGNVYFIHPLKGFISNDKEATKKLEYDITYLSGNDSAIYTFTYFTENVFKTDSVIIQDASGDRLYSATAIMYYVQPKGKSWQQRASISIPYETLVRLYSNPSPYSLALAGTKDIRYEIKPKTWRKHSRLISRIFEIVKYNN